MNKINFFLPMSPPTVTHQEKKVRVVKGKPIFYEPPELKAARQKLIAHLGGHVPADKFEGALRLIATWCFPITGKHVDGEYRATKPDTDNLQKLLKDVMTDLGFWADDAQVACEIVEKFWAKSPGIYIAIEELYPMPPKVKTLEEFKKDLSDDELAELKKADREFGRTGTYPKDEHVAELLDGYYLYFEPGVDEFLRSKKKVSK